VGTVAEFEDEWEGIDEGGSGVSGRISNGKGLLRPSEAFRAVSYYKEKRERFTEGES
jgi:hypothetical protein